MDADEVATIAQSYVALRPVVILGAGASAAHGLPTMPALADHILSAVSVPPRTRGRPSWLSFERKLRAGIGLEQALHEVELNDALLDSVVRETWCLTNAKCLQVYNRLLPSTSALPLQRLFRHLLFTANAKVQVVTTNYDRLAEYAASRNETPAYTGFSVGDVGTFQLSNESIQPPKGISVWKVHGSLDWFGGPAGFPIRRPLAPAIPDAFRPLIVTPGVTKYLQTHHEPFRSVLAQSDRALQSATAFLCVGYGFNDVHVQEHLVRRAQTGNIPIVVVTKELSNSARKHVLGGQCKRFLAIESAPGGSIVYTPRNPAGQLLVGDECWSLPGFLNLILGTEPNDDL